MKVRVRIAPTPSGKLHLGTAHTALFNFLFARRHQGKFILRIDDSDPKRCSEENKKDIINSLKWLGLNWDEGPDIGGAYGPYCQSERMDIYKSYIKRLLREGKAYYCYCTPKELEEERKEMVAKKLPPRYSGKCRHLSPEQIKEFKRQGRRAAVRLKVPGKRVSFIDPSRGKITVDTSNFGDFIIARSDGTALLGVASTIDDIEMKITHAIRGEDYLNFVPRQILIYEALGIKPPIFAHLPFVYAPNGSKLSKRHGSMAVSDYRRKGYLAEAIFNYLALLGWSPGNGKEILSKQEIIKLFSLDKVNTNSYRFDLKKLNYINGVYIRKTDNQRLIQLIRPFLKNWKFDLTEKKLKKIIPLIKERIIKLTDAKDLIDFFVREIKYDIQLLLDKNEKKLIKKQLEAVNDKLFLIKKWLLKNIVNSMENLCKNENWDKRQFFMTLRIVITGKSITPPLLESIEILGKEETLKRVRKAIKLLEIKKINGK